MLNINKTIEDSKVTFALEGRLDTITSPDFENELKGVLDSAGELIIDFGKLEYISSAGLRVLLSAHKTMSKQGSMTILNVNSTIMEIFEVTGFADILNIVTGKFSEERSRYIENLNRYSLLIIDDLGIERCTEFDPQKRYKNAAELLEALSKNKPTYLMPLVALLAALSIGLGGYYFTNTTIKTTTDNPQPKQNTANTATQLPQSIWQQKVELTKLKQVGYDWWFNKSTLKIIDEKNNIYNFKGKDDKGPVVIVENVSDYTAVNPVLKLELYSFGMKSEDFEWRTDSSHIEKITFSRKDRLGISRRVIIQLTGTIPPHSQYTFSGLQNVKDFYMYYKGDHGTVLGNIECPNMIPKNVGYQFNLK